MRRARACAATIAAFALAACMNIQVETDYDTSADFGSLRTWDWWPEMGVADDPRISGLVDERVREALEAELPARGFAMATSSPDFYVVYHAVIEQKADVKEFGRRYRYTGGFGRYGGGWRRSTYVDEYELGTLVVDVIRARDRALLWRGTASARIHERDSTARREQRIREAVEQMLERFPPV